MIAAAFAETRCRPTSSRKLVTEGQRLTANMQFVDMDRAASITGSTTGEGAARRKVTYEARPRAQAGCARPGARDGRVHRPDDPAMRMTGTPVGASGDHRGKIRASFGMRTGGKDLSHHGARGTPHEL